jgi:hypothetical protein
VDDEHWTRLTVRILAIRDIVSRLVAYESRRHANPRLFFEEISQSTERRIQTATGAEPDDPTVFEFQESLQREVDSIVGEAQQIATAGPAKKGP